MELHGVAKKIEEKIGLLERGRQELKTLAIEKATKAAQYECQLAVTLIKLKNGEAFELQGQTICKPPATIMEKIAKGICWQEKLEADQAEAEYKLTVKKMDSVQAELNGWQSIHKHWDER